MCVCVCVCAKQCNIDQKLDIAAARLSYVPISDISFLPSRWWYRDWVLLFRPKVSHVYTRTLHEGRTAQEKIAGVILSGLHGAISIEAIGNHITSPSYIRCRLT